MSCVSDRKSIITIRWTYFWKIETKKLQKEKRLTELLGSWNDGAFTIIQLQKTIDEAKINTEKITWLESLKIKIAAENNVFLKEIKLAILELE